MTSSNCNAKSHLHVLETRYYNAIISKQQHCGHQWRNSNIAIAYWVSIFIIEIYIELHETMQFKHNKDN